MHPNGYKLSFARYIMRVRLVVDGKEVPLNAYVQSVFGNVLSALVSTLKGVDEDWKELKVEVRR